MLWPGTPDDPMQIVDVRDLANFTIDCLDKSISGTFNMVNPPGSLTLGELLEDCKAITSADVEPVWVPAEFLDTHEAGTESGVLPCWHGGGEGALGVSAERAIAAGMRNRPERETARDILTWWDTLPDERTAQPRAGLPADKEAAIIAAWKESQS